jgi:phospholipid/cholesterol/gamma-HCH transport system permease protein
LKARAVAAVEPREEADRWVVALSGRWTIETAAGLDRRMAGLRPAPGAQPIAFDLGAVERLDSAGAWLVYRAMMALGANGRTVELTGADPAHVALIERIAGSYKKAGLGRPSPSPLMAMLERTGEATITAAIAARDLLGFLGQTLVTGGRLLLRPGRIRFTSTVHHIEQVGLNALPIVGLLSFLIGVVMAYQGADQLQRFGADIYTVNLLAVSVLREIGVLMTAIVVAGRSGSAFTAQIGTMKVNQEIDAMLTLGIDPVEVLVVPRLLALLVALPLLTFYADVMGLIGGAFVCYFALDITPDQFLRQLKLSLSRWTLWIGIMKAPVFALVIALVGCFEGLKVSSNAESVGRQTTKAVVAAIFIVIVLDAFFSILFSMLRI